MNKLFSMGAKYAALLRAVACMTVIPTATASPRGWRNVPYSRDAAFVKVLVLRHFYSRRPRPWRGWKGCRRAGS